MKTTEQFQKELSDKNPNIILMDEYKGKEKKVLCQCKICENQWLVTPRNLSSGSGCPECARNRRGRHRKLSELQFAEEVKINNPNIFLMENYVNMKTYLNVRCIVCGHEWLSRPDHILAGTGCPNCKGAMKKSNDIFLKELSKINNFIQPIEEYKNSKTKIMFKCKMCSYEWKAQPIKILGGTGCPNCNNRNKTSFSEQAIFYYIKKIHEDSKNRYIFLGKKRIELDIYIPSMKIAIEYDGMYWHKNKKQLEREKYEICRNNGITLIRIVEQDNNTIENCDFKIVREKPFNYSSLDKVILRLFLYLNIDTEVDTQKEEIKIKEQYYRDLRKNSLQTVFPDLSGEWCKSLNGDITPFMVAAASNEKFYWECVKCKNIWTARVCDRTLKGRGCPECAKKRIAEKRTKSNDDFIRELYQINDQIVPLETYSSAHSNIKVRCLKCGYEWNSYPANLLKGRQCLMCTRKNAGKGITLSEEEFNTKVSDKLDNIILIDKYKNKKTSLQVKCKKCGCEWKAMPMTLCIKGTSCKNCKRLSKEDK